MSRKKRKGPSSSAAARDQAPARGGLMSLRRGLQGVAGTSSKGKARPPTRLGRLGDVVFWILTLAVVGFVLYSRFLRH